MGPVGQLLRRHEIVMGRDGAAPDYSDLVTFEALRNCAGSKPRAVASGICKSWIGTMFKSGRQTGSAGGSSMENSAAGAEVPAASDPIQTQRPLRLVMVSHRRRSRLARSGSAFSKMQH